MTETLDTAAQQAADAEKRRLSEALQSLSGLTSDTPAARLAHDKLQNSFQGGELRMTQVLQQVEAAVPVDRLVPSRDVRFQHLDDGGIDIIFPTDKEDKEGSLQRFGIHRHAYAQLAQSAGIPKRYADLLVDDGQSDLLSNNFHRRFEYLPHTTHLVREVNGRIFGWLSRNFKRFDTAPLLLAFIKECSKYGAVPTSAHYMEVRTHLRMVLPYVFEPVPGEAVAFGATFTSGDFGGHSYRCQVFLERLLCLNGMMGQDGLRKIHLGKKIEEDTVQNTRIIELETELVVEKTRETIKRFFHPEYIQSRLDTIKDAHEKRINIAEAINDLAKRARLTRDEAKRATELYATADLQLLPSVSGQTAPGEGSVWRLSNVFSLLAAESDKPERGLELQDLAGEQLGLTRDAA
jgi:hypothetical protein